MQTTAPVLSAAAKRIMQIQSDILDLHKFLVLRIVVERNMIGAAGNDERVEGGRRLLKIKFLKREAIGPFSRAIG